MFEIIQGGVTAPKGFYAAAAAAGIKYQGRDDMALICSECDAVAAGTYTTNRVKAAPVIWDREITSSDRPVRVVVVNSGIANACTGQEGLGYCEQTAQEASDCLSLRDSAVLVASTGVIGMPLPMERIRSGIRMLVPKLEGTDEAANRAAKAIMTTDTHEKEAAVSFLIGQKKVTIGGMCKGSGMIHPNMCTMLSFITTDAAISKELLQEALSADVEDTYNMISVDGDTSTNDTVLLLANGMAGNPVITKKDAHYQAFCDALHYINETLAKAMAADGEGATALFTAKVVHAKTKEQAKVLAKSVICSNLTKAAIFGHDANWGRILCAMGYAGVDFDPEQVDLYFESAAGSIQLIRDGVALAYSEETATRILSEPAVTAIADLKEGDQEAEAWGCDLTYDYVKINADYRS